MRTWLAALAALLWTSIAVAGPTPKTKSAASPAQAPRAAPPAAEPDPVPLTLLPEKPAAAPEPPPPPPPVRSVTAYAPRDAEANAVTAESDKPASKAWGLVVRAGALRSGESYTAPSAVGALGLGGSYAFTPEIAAALDVGLRLSEQGYVGAQADGAGNHLTAELAEQRYDVTAGAGYDVGRKLVESGRLVLAPGLGVQFLTLRNGAFDANLLGANARLRSRFELSSAVGVYGQVGWTYNLLKNDSLSAVGAPLWNLGGELGVELPLSGGFALDLAYLADVLALANDLRTAHGTGLTFKASF